MLVLQIGVVVLVMFVITTRRTTYYKCLNWTTKIITSEIYIFKNFKKNNNANIHYTISTQ